MIIDINGYCGNWPYWPIKVRSSDSLVELLDRFEIDKVVVTSTRGAFVDCAEGNAETARVMEEKPSRVLGFATVNPRDEDGAVAELQGAHAQGMKGLRLFPQHHYYRLDDDPILAEILGTAGELRMPVLIPARLITNQGMPTLDVRDIGKVAGMHPDTYFIIGGVNYGEMRDALAVMRKQDNVAIETSSMQGFEGVRTLVEKVGAERVYFGTGLPLQYPGVGLAKIVHAEISEDAKALVLGGNAERLLSL